MVSEELITHTSTRGGGWIPTQQRLHPTEAGDASAITVSGVRGHPGGPHQSPVTPGNTSFTPHNPVMLPRKIASFKI